MYNLETKVFEFHNHALTLENFIDRYETIRVQNMITETLLAVFPGTSAYARKLDLYDSQKIASLY